MHTLISHTQAVLRELGIGDFAQESRQLHGKGKGKAKAKVDKPKSKPDASAPAGSSAAHAQPPARVSGRLAVQPRLSYAPSKPVCALPTKLCVYYIIFVNSAAPPLACLRPQVLPSDDDASESEEEFCVECDSDSSAPCLLPPPATP